jgi:hypothetical protein
MTDPNRRYEGLPLAELELPSGEVVRYRSRRFLPRGSSLPVLAKVSVAEGERLDLISSRAYGTAEALWRICDANDAMNPTDLTREQVGTVLTVPLPR